MARPVPAERSARAPPLPPVRQLVAFCAEAIPDPISRRRKSSPRGTRAADSVESCATGRCADLRLHRDVRTGAPTRSLAPDLTVNEALEPRERPRTGHTCVTRCTRVGRHDGRPVSTHEYADRRRKCESRLSRTWRHSTRTGAHRRTGASAKGEGPIHRAESVGQRPYVRCGHPWSYPRQEIDTVDSSR